MESVWQEMWQASGFDSIDDLPSSLEIPYPHVPHNRAVLAVALAVADAFERFSPGARGPGRAAGRAGADSDPRGVRRRCLDVPPTGHTALRDGKGTLLKWCRAEHGYLDSPSHDRVEMILRSAQSRSTSNE